ncbi:cellulose binding domain-containing protein [Actinosynnema pretiosum subsp. pretiosum]|uniref:Cellulose binding domain-containing protein n=1 Tax=Actinosynnema pretiosum subsp. pretiosum TaxID=103721 RepID=A0AA45L8J1_9PSEU|nr:cellulose-binding, family II [Actinosynnema pretiosum subsp. pretiosum]QUF05033.1 cellulose binding domain-containing protein [Actinosynnema pretiosum subsp. pretiosum]
MIPRTSGARPRPTGLRPAAALGVLTAVAAAVTLAAVPSPARAATGCRVDYRVSSQWAGGFTANVDVTNLGDPVTSWRLTWAFGAGQAVTQAWGGVAAQTGAQVRVDNAAWNGSLATGASTSFGFTGTWTGANPPPAQFALGGVTCTGSTTPTTTTTTTTAPPSDVLAKAHTVGRVRQAAGAARYTWPGIAFEGRFRGTGVGVTLNDAVNDYDVQVDGATVATLVTPGRTTHRVQGLTNGVHTVRVVKRTEVPWSAGEFGGFTADPGGELLDKPAPRTRQIEFIGDSLTAGYGNTSTSRDCSATGVDRKSNADLTFGALTARALGADHQINAQSGRGMVRNYNGGDPGTDFRTSYARGLQNEAADVWQNPPTWRPQLVVVGLGTNDFSTPVNPGEPWTADTLVTAYKAAYQGFLDKLRATYGPNAVIVVNASNLFAQTAQQVVTDRNAQGDTRVRFWNHDDPRLDRLGCDWHYSTADHRLLSTLLTDYIATLPLTW